tara:strand:+ start:405 stop:1013 length:609 start_codon:yes stop_codon:yes gene_type:complete
MFFTLEGSEGVGKSTLIESLKDFFKENEIDFLFTREPGGTKEGQEIRKILLDQSLDLNPYAETFLLLADRIQHVEKIIRPALQSNKHVLSDRYVESTFAYQGAGRGLNQRELEGFIKNLNFPEPNLTIYLDLPVQEGLKRVKNRGKTDRFERENLIFFEKIRSFYLDLVKKDPQRYFLIDASIPIDEVFRLAKDRILKELNE